MVDDPEAPVVEGGAMSHIIGLRLTNFLRYRGLVELNLEPKAYAIVAEWDGDPARSNWAGKSSLVWAIRFALTGDHPRRTEDEWITDGEKDGGVDLEASCGLFVSRTRIRGGRPTLRVIIPQVDGTERECHGEDAQVELDRYLGHDKDDAAATWWVGQGAMARLVSTEASKLSAIVTGWLELDKIDDALSHVQEAGRKAQGRAGERLRVIAWHRERMLGGNLCDVAADNRAAHEAEVRRLEGAVDELGGSGAITRWMEWQRDGDAHARWERLQREQADHLKREPAKVNADSYAVQRQSVAGLGEQRAIASKELDLKRSLARGEFSGKCPVGDIVCPVKDRLNADSATNRVLAGVALDAHTLAQLAHEEGIRELKKYEEGLKDYSEWAGKCRWFDDRIVEEAPAARRYVEVSAPPDPTDVQSAIAALESARSAAKSHSAAVVQALKHEQQIAELPFDDESKRAQACREAAQILGRNGAPRAIAESALAELEAHANAALARCGIDLRVRVRWAREGKQLAKTCYTCGAPFPASQRVKACQECGAERGQQLEEKLAIECSADSGGALDLAGAVVQLSAARWLRLRRGYSWAVAVLDEPLGQLDQHNRKALSTKLAGALGQELGLAQAFVVAHDPAVLDAMPGRIRVLATAEGSKAVVE